MLSKYWFSKQASDTKNRNDTHLPTVPTETIPPLGQSLQNIKTQLELIPTPFLILVTFSLGLAFSVSGKTIHTRYGRRIKNGDWVTPDVFAKRRWVRGIVTSVGDADNFRLFHTPPLGGWRWPLKFRRVPTLSKELKDQTLHVRISGVDAPEGAHFGKPAQLYAAESLAWLRKKILGKPIYCQLIKRDQYSRIVANVYLPPRLLPGALFHGKSLSIEMLRDGWATTYKQAGAEYGTLSAEEYERIEREAKAARRGMWGKGTKIETPAEYKRRHNSSIDSNAPQKQKPTLPEGRHGRLLRLFQRK